MKKQSKILDDAKFYVKNKKWLKYSEEIAFRVLFQLKEKNLSQKDLAEILKVSPQHINKLLSGEENLTLMTISKIEEALDFNLIHFSKYKSKKSISII